MRRLLLTAALAGLLLLTPPVAGPLLAAQAPAVAEAVAGEPVTDLDPVALGHLLTLLALTGALALHVTVRLLRVAGHTLRRSLHQPPRR